MGELIGPRELGDSLPFSRTTVREALCLLRDPALVEQCARLALLQDVYAFDWIVTEVYRLRRRAAA